MAIAGWTALAVFGFAFQCQTPRWQYFPSRCLGEGAIMYPIVAINMLVDLALVALPTVMLWNVQMPLARRVKLIATFASRIVVMMNAAIITTCIPNLYRVMNSLALRMNRVQIPEELELSSSKKSHGAESGSHDVASSGPSFQAGKGVLKVLCYPRDAGTREDSKCVQCATVYAGDHDGAESTESIIASHDTASDHLGIMAPWGLTTLALLTTTISILIKPTGHPSLLENVKRNVLMFSPSQSAILVVLLLLDLIGWRLLSLADIHAGLMILNHYYFTSGPSGLEHKVWWRFTRRAFLMVGTVPLYVILLRSEQSPWIKVIVTPLVADSMLAELLSLHWDASDEDLIYNRDWPRNTLVVKPANPPTRNHHENREGADEKKKTNENRDTSSSVTTENLCERVYGLWSPVAEADDKQDPRSLPPNDANLEKIFSPTYQAPGYKCRHWRCLIYRVKYLATRIVRWPLLFGDLALITWLLHRDLQPVTLLVADALLDIRLLKDLLTLSYYACIFSSDASLLWSL
ncbi:hypothetical protein ANOM_008008 [Aspergillus nomiae NRRL 13137]|uniref:Rhodopsin domain-containing protein n=1 Tax=Aspergillus nomiae NRRL (strain ATCC 15546 / NRRL 13137 / CBS 260.88 / M93) TaxID=1509407 RepID=A0A0L1IXA1_ASPN3|nr:uncharacterized protein ANOM_008008 [Aspergillus nomiae NRRL 13137]KNG83808.1 hypothetical protein ANOM_008008 [Aspergillus nomiae NRRL 13137]